MGCLIFVASCNLQAYSPQLIALERLQARDPEGEAIWKETPIDGGVLVKSFYVVSQMQIDYLADHPDVIPTLARWLHDQWGHLSPGASVERGEASLRANCNRDRIPLAVVALVDGEPVGVARFVEYDMDIRRDLSPWLSSVFVPSEHRRKGIGTALTRRIMDESKALGVVTFYLFTPDRETFYSRLGWTVLERTEYRGEQIVIMKLDVAG